MWVHSVVCRMLGPGLSKTSLLLSPCAVGMSGRLAAGFSKQKNENCRLNLAARLAKREGWLSLQPLWRSESGARLVKPRTSLPCVP